MSYQKLVTEALIDPIRSVLIIDDEYPTWEGVLTDVDFSGDRKKILKTIQAFRTHEPGKKPSLIVDIHDGKDITAPNFGDLAQHLHQSDLLVLDFQLDGDDGGGKKSVGIARQLLENEHFNLIVVHTASDLGDAFEEMVIGLLPQSAKVPPGLLSRASTIWSSFVTKMLDDEGLDEDEVRSSLNEVLKLQHYIACFKGQNSEVCSFSDIQAGVGLFQPFMTLMTEWEVAEKDRHFVAIHYLNEICAEFLCPESDESRRTLSWNDERNTDAPFWIRTNRGFIAFADKKTTDLVPVLTTALEHWQPTPIRLLSAKLRSQLDKQGVIAEDEVFKDRQVFHKFYSLLTAQKTDQKVKNALEAQMRRHTETLVDKTMGPVIEYGKRVVETDPKGDGGGLNYIDFFGNLDSGDKSTADRYNSFMSTKPPSGWHVEPGHIFCLKDDADGTNHYWVCLSPACDMVPGQRKIGIQWKDESIRPFLAVRLEQGNNNLTDDQINSNEFVFLLQPDESIKILSLFVKGSTPAAVEGDDAEVEPELASVQNKQPHWRMFYACGGGEFDPQKLSNEDVRITKLQWLVASEESLTVKSDEVTVSWQLRYEYALNLNQKLGSSLTRVGLEYST
jgi:hypothetical protein